jgi:hypothetical protein
MFAKFVYWTGALDFLVGAGTMGAALYNAFNAPVPGQFTALMTLGMFLWLAAALLMWASRDVAARAPVIVWQGLVRLTACVSILYAVPNGLAQSPYEYAVVPFDGTIGLVYIVGTLRITGRSFASVLAFKE